MAKKKGEVEIVFSGDIKDLNKYLGKIGEKSKKEFEKAEKSSKSFYKSLAVGAGVVGAAGLALFALTKRTAESMDSVLNFSNATGIAVDSLSRLSHVAEINKTSFDDVKTSIVRLVKTMGDASTGSKEQVEAFERLGLSIYDANGEMKNAESMFYEVSGALGKVENKTQRLSMAQDIFGRSADKLGSLLDSNAESLKQLSKESDELGKTFDREAAEKAAKFNDELARLKASIIGVAQDITVTAGPAFVNMFKAVIPMVSKLAKGFDYIFGNLEASASLAGRIGIDFEKAQAEMSVLEIEADQGRQKLREFAEAIAEADKSGKAVTFGGITTSVEVAKESFGFASKAVESLNGELNHAIAKYASVGIAFESTADDVVKSAKKIEEVTGESFNPNSNKLSKSTKEKKEKKGKEVDFQEIIRRNKEIEDEKLDYVYAKQIEKEDAELESIKNMKEEKLLAISEAHEAEMQAARDLQSEFDSMQSGLQKSVSDPIIDGIFEAAEEGKSIMGTIFDNLKSSAKSGIADSLSGILSGGLASLATGNPFSVVGAIGSAFGFASGGPVGDKGLIRVNESERIYTAQDHSQVKQLTSAVNALISNGGSSNNTFHISGSGSPQATAFAIKRMNDNVSRRKVPNRMAEVYQ